MCLSDRFSPWPRARWRAPEEASSAEPPTTCSIRILVLGSGPHILRHCAASRSTTMYPSTQHSQPLAVHHHENIYGPPQHHSTNVVPKTLDPPKIKCRSCVIVNLSTDISTRLQKKSYSSIQFPFGRSVRLLPERLRSSVGPTVWL
jgi:hypothetical protein